MTAAINRTDKIKQLFKVLQKRYKHAPKPPERLLLEHLMFSACLENTAYDSAESAYSVLEHHYIDWNELRVSTPQEIADTLPMLPAPLEAGMRIKKTLQWVFETSYMFDLEDYRKKTIGQLSEYLNSISACTPFMINFVVLFGLSGHQIPFDEASLRIMRRLDLTKVVNGKEEVPGIERVITKVQGPEFSILLHVLGVDFFHNQNAPELLTLLKGIDKTAPSRDWKEPEGVIKKEDVKPLPSRVAMPIKGFKPVIDLDDDEETELSDAIPEEDAIEFIDHGLASLASAGTSKDTSEVPSNRKGKKTSKKSTEITEVVDEDEDLTTSTEQTMPIDHHVEKRPSLKSANKLTENKPKESPRSKKKNHHIEEANNAINKPTEKAKPGKKVVLKTTEKNISSKKDAKKEESKPPKKTEKSTSSKKKAKNTNITKDKTSTPTKSNTKKLQQKKPR